MLAMSWRFVSQPSAVAVRPLRPGRPTGQGTDVVFQIAIFSNMSCFRCVMFQMCYCHVSGVNTRGLEERHYSIISFISLKKGFPYLMCRDPHSISQIDNVNRII